MNNFYSCISTFAIALVSALVLFPLVLRLGCRIGLMDSPDQRKVHRSPVPVVGGLVIVLSVLVTLYFSEGLQWLAGRHLVFSVCIMILLITGVADDRTSLSPWLRFVVQTGCAFAVAFAGMRLQSLHGLFGYHQLPIAAQYGLTVLIVVGVTNAFNLIDGINGLAGGMVLLNVVALSATAVVAKQAGWLHLLLALAAGLLVFLRYNWRSARLFMGDGGSLVLGFILAVTGIALIRASYSQGLPSITATVATVTACCMIPVMDTLRVFYSRMRRGHSPFHADKNHLHHLFLRHHLTHAQAAARILVVHVFMLLCSIVCVRFFGLLWVIAGQVLFILFYSWMLQLLTHFVRSYRFVKRLEARN